jgi:hypothetical protein
MARDDQIGEVVPRGVGTPTALPVGRGRSHVGSIEEILEAGRRTRQAVPRWLWLAAAVIGVICTTGFGVMILGGAEPSVHPVGRRSEPGRDAGAGFGTGLGIGAGGGVAIGFALARQRRDHSSRRRP